MSLLSEIQRDLLKPEARLSDILRKARVFAYQLKSEDLKVWTSSELDGYEGDPDSVPGYRILETQTYGHFSGPFGREMRNASIPTVGLSEEAGKYSTTFYFRQGIRELESLLEKGETSFHFAWPADNVVAISEKIYQGYVCMQAWWHISAQQVEQILDTVRNRLLTFILELGEMDFDFSEEARGEHLPAEAISHVFNNYILGDHAILGVGGNVVQSITQVVKTGDLNSLKEYLKRVGVPDEDSDFLIMAIEKDGETSKEQGFGPRVKEWLGGVVQKVTSGLWKIGVDVAPTVIAKAISAYYGWDQAI